MTEERKVSQLPTRTDITGEEYMHIGHNGRSYKTTINSIISKFNGGVNLEVLQEIQNKLTELAELGNLVTVEQMAAAIAAIPEVDLSSYATSQAVAVAIEQAIAGIPAADLSGYATTAYVDGLIAEIPLPDMSNVAMKSDIPDVSGYATLADIPAPQDLSAYAKTADLPAVPDLTEYVKAVDLPAALDLSGYATKQEIPDVTGFFTQRQVQQAITDAFSTTDEFVRTSETPIGRILWVSGQVIETQDGSMMAPFATIQQAVDRASNDNNAWTIICMPATGSGYTNDVTISDKANILIQGWGAQGAHNVVIKGTVTITGATTTRISFRDIAIRPPADVPGLVFDGTQGCHYFQNVNVENTTGAISPIVIFCNGEQRWTSFDKCDIGGRVVIEPTVNANLAVYFNGQNHADCHLEINGGGNTYIRDGGQFGSVEHNAGNLEVKYVGTWTGNRAVAIASTAVANRCYVSFCDFESANGYTLLDGNHIVVKNCNTLAP